MNYEGLQESKETEADELAACLQTRQKDTKEGDKEL